MARARAKQLKRGSPPKRGTQPKRGAPLKRGAQKKSAAKPARVSTHPVKKRTRESLAIIARLREVCLALPDATEQIAWGEPTWRIRGKIFAQLDDHHHGSEHVAVWLPAPPGAQEALIDADPARFFRPPYVGHRGWIAIVLETEPDWDMVASLVAQAHELIGASRRAR